MKTYFRSHIILLILASICLGNLTFISAAQAGESERINRERENELREERETRERNRQNVKELDRAIQETRPQFGDGSGAGFDIFGILLTSPSIISGQDGIGYGSQVKLPINSRFDLRGGATFGSKRGISLNGGATYRLIEGGFIQPFVGSSFQTGGNPGLYGNAGVDIPFGGGMGISAQINQGLIGFSGSTVQGTIHFIGQ